MARSKITKANFKKAFGGRHKAAIAIGVSRPTIDAWVKQGFIPEICINYNHYGLNWHDKIRELGFNPETLKKLDVD